MEIHRTGRQQKSSKFRPTGPLQGAVLSQTLSPKVDFRVRIPVLITLLIPVGLASQLSPFWRTVACVMPLMLTGTFRISRIRGEWMDSRLYLGFVPVWQQRCKLQGVMAIGTRYGGSEPGYWTFILFGPIQWISGWIFDYLVPAIGGPYELWLETAKGREFIVWQGHNQQHFEKNLELLRNQTGAEIRPR